MSQLPTPTRARAPARKRDEVVRRLTKRYEKLAGTADEPRLRPAFRSLAIVTLMLERSYAALRDRESWLNSDMELCASLDSVRRLASTQSDLLRTCGLTIASISAPREKILDLEAIRDVSEA